MQNVLMVENTSILMNAIEAMRHHSLKKKETIIIVTSFHETNLSQLMKAIKINEWSEVYFPALTKPTGKEFMFKGSKLIGPSNRILQMFHKRLVLDRVKRIAASKMKVNYLICGVYANDLAITFANSISFREYCLVDDGNMTIFIAAGRQKEELYGFSHVLGVNSIASYDGVWGHLKKCIKRFMLGIKDKGIKNITFFTSHHDITLIDNDRLIKNCYAKTDEPSEQLVESNLVYFLGAPVVEREIMSLDSYRFFLQSINSRYENYSILYFPHRMEGEIGLKIVRENFVSANIMAIDVPIETHILNAPTLPETVSSFYSSALTNIASMNIAGLKIEAIYIPAKLVVKREKRMLVEKVYEDFKKRQTKSFVVVDLIKADQLVD